MARSAPMRLSVPVTARPRHEPANGRNLRVAALRDIVGREAYDDVGRQPGIGPVAWRVEADQRKVDLHAGVGQPEKVERAAIDPSLVSSDLRSSVALRHLTTRAAQVVQEGAHAVDRLADLNAGPLERTRVREHSASANDHRHGGWKSFA